jgi:hypothetical protein
VIKFILTALIILICISVKADQQNTRGLNNSRKFICIIKSIPGVTPQQLLELKRYIGCLNVPAEGSDE